MDNFDRISAFLNKLPILEQKISDDDLEEANATSGGEAVTIPHAFSGGTDAPYGPRAKMGDKNSGFPNKVDKKRKNFESIQDKWYQEINEISYKAYSGQASQSGRKEINMAIKEINSMLIKIERMVTHATKLKKSKGIKPADFWRVTKNKVDAIDVRLDKLKFKLKDLAR